jgi:hypothetical protein
MRKNAIAAKAIARKKMARSIIGAVFAVNFTAVPVQEI